jgi:predicted metal-dependent phosphoesterase TrpH
MVAPAQDLNRREFPEMEKNRPRKILNIPDIDGYITIKGDFHMHSVFSDGSVWPENRVEEAWCDGLDVIALTDHDVYHPHKEYVKTDNNIPWEIALRNAAGKNILVIPGVEITRKMPPGHFNALFITDGNLPELDDTSRQAFLASVEKFISQGAVIIWNHPGWIAQQKDSVRWFDIHQLLVDKGWLHGIEVFNYIEWYPVALNWAMTKHLAPFANSDIHDPIVWAYGDDPDFIRPMTLVFAGERSVESIREAILERRTVAWFNGHLAGSPELLGALFDKSVQFRKISSDNGKSRYRISNPTDLTFRIKGLTSDWQGDLEITSRSEADIRVPDGLRILKFEVTNLHTGMKENLVREIKIE